MYDIARSAEENKRETFNLFSFEKNITFAREVDSQSKTKVQSVPYFDERSRSTISLSTKSENIIANCIQRAIFGKDEENDNIYGITYNAKETTG